ncbi:SDR family oxidoreductase [Rhodospirillaceae bacterium AH-315-P19]|nr:SDR family oxidoreductase [Rhodospirillaceae bacterium AH-315-P19]
MTATTHQTALVTGAGQRIGRAIALDLARHGWRVALHYHHSPEAAQSLAEEIQQAGSTVVLLKADLADEAETAELVPRAIKALGPLGLLVNNASVFELDTMATATRQSWDAHMEVNLRAPFVLSQAFANALPPETHGNIINLIDQRVWNLTPHFISYTLSKAGLWTLTQTMALALAPRIRVNAIGPGPTLPSQRQTAEQFSHQAAKMPLGRGTTPEEICAALRFLLAAPAMTGQMMALDGGQHLGWAPPPNETMPCE